MFQHCDRNRIMNLVYQSRTVDHYATEHVWLVCSWKKCISLTKDRSYARICPKQERRDCISIAQTYFSFHHDPIIWSKYLLNLNIWFLLLQSFVMCICTSTPLFALQINALYFLLNFIPKDKTFVRFTSEINTSVEEAKITSVSCFVILSSPNYFKYVSTDWFLKWTLACLTSVLQPTYISVY